MNTAKNKKNKVIGRGVVLYYMGSSHSLLGSTTLLDDWELLEPWKTTLVRSLVRLVLTQLRRSLECLSPKVLEVKPLLVWFGSRRCCQSSCR